MAAPDRQGEGRLNRHYHDRVQGNRRQKETPIRYHHKKSFKKARTSRYIASIHLAQHIAGGKCSRAPASILSIAPASALFCRGVWCTHLSEAHRGATFASTLARYHGHNRRPRPLALEAAAATTVRYTQRTNAVGGLNDDQQLFFYPRPPTRCRYAFLNTGVRTLAAPTTAVRYMRRTVSKHRHYFLR